MAIKDYYCVVDKTYTNGKKGVAALRFVSIRVKEHPSIPKDSATKLEHATIRYSWFEDPNNAKEYQTELLSKEIINEDI